ncbi:MAG TPA: HPr(Ser) kinase/phosphatase, partial [Anaerolineales bacterium]
GNTEMSYLRTLPRERKVEVIRAFFAQEVAALTVTKDLDIPPEMVAAAEEAGVPLLKTTHLSSVFIATVQACLEDSLTASTSMHGVLLDVFGVGILLLGKSGIGKSEIALDLVMRGHRLVADDIVDVKRKGDSVVGQGSEIIKHHMEVRGLGIINIKDLFGVAAIRERKKIEIVLELVDWDPSVEYDRLGVEDRKFRILDSEIAMMVVPVRPGRNMTTIVEVAARNHLLKLQGHHSAREFQDRLTHSAIATFIPIAMLLILTSRHPMRIEKWKAALVIPVVSVAVISPWILRNALTFDAFVPLRNGFGFNTYIGNPALVETYRPSDPACLPGTAPAFQASSPWEAVNLTLLTENQRALYTRAYQCIEQDAPSNYSQLNEAQRDRLYMKKVLSFLLSEPVQWIQVTFYKVILFFGSHFSQLMISLMAIIGAIISIKKSQARILSLLILGFAAPYILAIPFYYRYRYPVEPLLIILASYPLYAVIQIGIKLAGNIKGHEGL